MLPCRIGTAGACGLSARVMSGCLKLSPSRVFGGQCKCVPYACERLYANKPPGVIIHPNFLFKGQDTPQPLCMYHVISHSSALHFRLCLTRPHPLPAAHPSYPRCTFQGSPKRGHAGQDREARSSRRSADCVGRALTCSKMSRVEAGANCS